MPWEVFFYQTTAREGIDADKYVVLQGSDISVRVVEYWSIILSICAGFWAL